MDKHYIPIDKLLVGACYELEARNLRVGIWDGRAFHGVRHKMGDSFMDEETHHDLDDRSGTARATRRLT